MSNTSTRPLVPLSQCKKDLPVEAYHLIQREGKEMQEFGCIVKFGNRWLTDVPRFYEYLRHRTKKAG